MYFKSFQICFDFLRSLFCDLMFERGFYIVVRYIVRTMLFENQSKKKEKGQYRNKRRCFASVSLRNQIHWIICFGVYSFTSDQLVNKCVCETHSSADNNVYVQIRAG